MIGDFVYGNTISEVMSIVSRLKGSIILLVGNHDNMFNETHSNITNKFIVKHGIERIVLYNNYTLFMYHYPLLEWPDFHMNNTYHLYGHVHGDKEHPESRALDVGCNLHDFRLLSETKVIDILSKKQLIK
jgi:calcineurin-like phosphoesterase family protein